MPVLHGRTAKTEEHISDVDTSFRFINGTWKVEASFWLAELSAAPRHNSAWGHFLIGLRLEQCGRPPLYRWTHKTQPRTSNKTTTIKACIHKKKRWIYDREHELLKNQPDVPTHETLPVDYVGGILFEMPLLHFIDASVYWFKVYYCYGMRGNIEIALSHFPTKSIFT